MQIETVLFLIPLFPLLAFAVIILFTNRSNRLSHVVAVGSMAISWALGLYLFYQFIENATALHHRLEFSFDWLPTGFTSLELGFMIDPLSAVTLFFVVWTCLMIFLYSVGYHN